MYTFKQFQPYLAFILSFISFSYSFDFDGSSSSYAKFASWVPCQNGSIGFEFRTLLPNALLFYTDGGGSNDYYELKLVNGIMHLRFKINNDMNMLSAGQNLHNNDWHMVNITRDRRLTTLRVDEVYFTRESKNYNPTRDTLEATKENFAFIGGLPIEYNDRLSELSVPQVIFEPRLRGSVRNLFFSNCGKALSSPLMLDSQGIILKNDECLQKNLCKNEGICVMRDSGVQCDCSWTDYIGEFCEIERQPVEAMFHGAQYLMYDLTKRGDPIFSSNDRLTLHFKTTHMSGLLFYTGDDRDYMTVSLKNGAIHVAMNLGSGAYDDDVDMKGYKLDDGQWHNLVVTRNSRQITIEIDGAERGKGTTMGEFLQLSSNVLYVAGSPNTAEIQGSQVRTNFRGCMKQVKYEADSIKLDLVELANKDHDLISVVGEVVFGQCEDVVESQPITFTTPESFIALPRWDVKKNSGTIAFQFRTTESNGLLMYNSGSYGSSNLDFFALEIIDGYFYLILDLGTGAIKDKVSRTRVDDGNPHLVHFDYNGRKGFVRIDSHQTEYNTQGPGSQLDLEELLFIGGMDFERHNSYRLPKQVWSGTLRYGFVGCLQDLNINNNKVDMMTVARKQFQRDIVSECRKSESQCLSRPCMYKGTCTEGWNRYICDCQATAYTGKTCEQVAATLSFDEAQYVFITLPEESSTEAEDISLRFRTIRAGGLLFMTASTLCEDSIELYLEMGACKLTISLGSGSKTMSIGHALNDDQWHTVFVKRRGQNMELRVDSSRPVTDIIPQTATTIRITQIVLGSVGPMLSDVVSASNAALIYDDGMKSNMDMQNDGSVQQHTGFKGAMQQFIFNGNHYFDMAQKENIENIEVTARFDSGESVTRDAVTFESRDAFVILPQLHANKHFAIYFKFKTSENTGLILFNGRVGHDFLCLEIYQGYLFYIYDMGGGSQRIRVNTPEPLNDNKWHDVSLLRPQTEQQLIRVDNNPPTVENMKDHTARRFDLMGPLYLGGVVKTLYNSLPVQVLAKYGYLGCIASLDVNGYQMNILQAATLVEHSIVNGCSSSEMTCHASSCYNGGRCEQKWNSYSCDCDMTSFTGPACSDESVTYEFGMNRGMIVFEHLEDARPSTNSDYLTLGFKTIQDYAALVRVDSADTDDFIEMELIEGNIFVVYNMGQEDLPIGEAYHKVNDGKYHVIKFIRSGANATLQLDNWDQAYKYPIGKQMSVFNKQTRVWIGGRKDSAGKINNAFHGTMSGLVFNEMRILDYLKDGDPRTSSEGDIRLVSSSGGAISPPNKVKIETVMEDKNVQSTQGLKRLKRKRKRSVLPENSTRKKTETAQKRRPSKFFLQHKNLITQDFKKEDLSHENAIDKKKKKKVHKFQEIQKNSAQDPFDHSKYVTEPAIGSNTVMYDTIGENEMDHLIGGNVESLFSSGHGGLSYENDETDVEFSGYSIFGSGENVGDDEDGLEIERYKTKLKTISQLSSLTDYQNMDKTGPNQINVKLRTLDQAPFAIDHIFSKNSYPKDRGKAGKRSRKIHMNTAPHYSNSRKHSRGTTPKQKVTDDIIFSGVGPDCYNDDEDACIPNGSGTDDDIITPTIKITKMPTPSPDPSERRNNTDCKDCDTNPIILSPNDNSTTNTYNPNNPTDNTYATVDPRESKNNKKDNEHLNIFLIVGTIAGVLVALIILVVALYKCRTRDEGSYRVDESQNFAYLEAKKNQTNGSAVNNVGNGKTLGKKKDVKEWYV